MRVLITGMAQMILKQTGDRILSGASGGGEVVDLLHTTIG